MPLLAALASWLLLDNAWAAQLPANWGYCHIQPAPLAADTITVNDGYTHLSSDEAEAQDNRLYTLKGNVSVQRDGIQLGADHAVYDDATGEVHAEGSVRYIAESITLDSPRAQYNLTTDQGHAEKADYQLPTRHGRGKAREVQRENKDLTILHGATYTTCNPGNEDWLLRAQRVDLDQASGMGTAVNASLSFMGVPFLYLPYVNFPITDERMSGLLTPSIGHSQTSGLEFSWPMYWNIAPARDATFTPRYIERRGTQLNGEFRYLTTTSLGRFYGEYLPDDSTYNQNRSLITYHDTTHLSAGWGIELLANHASDTQYFHDLSTSLTAASTSYLENRADLTHAGPGGNFTARLQSYQIIDQTVLPSNRPYERLPQLLYALHENAPQDVSYGLDGEYVRFQRDSSITGSRLDLRPAISQTKQGADYLLTPTLTLRHTRYLLDNATPGANSNPERTLPVASIDGRAFIERDLSLTGRPWLQTLEPRFYYLYVPYEDQSNLPVFDTTALDFSYDQLFRDNRYSGADRVGDANQLSIAVNSRLLERETGTEWLRAGIGQIYYFHDRKVTLPGEAIQTSARSDIVAEVQGQIDTRWRALAQWQWKQNTDQTDMIGLQLRYRGGPREIVNFSQRFRNDQLDQSDVSFIWPVTSQWRAIGRWDYSYREQRPVETLAGLEYESCCWAWRFILRRYVTDTIGTTNQAWFFQLELKGLSSLGNGIEKVMEHDILGYP